jgi:hypothetical protein
MGGLPEARGRNEGPVSARMRWAWGRFLVMSAALAATVGAVIAVPALLLPHLGAGTRALPPAAPRFLIGAAAALMAINVVHALWTRPKVMRMASILDQALARCPVCGGGPVTWEFVLGRLENYATCQACSARWAAGLVVGAQALRSLSLAWPGTAMTPEVWATVPTGTDPGPWLQWIAWRHGEGPLPREEPAGGN